MLFDCVKAECNHRFCRPCIERFSDCPVCGADVGSLIPDPEVQAAVELYISAHAGSHSIWELEGLASSTSAEEPRGRAPFLLQLGLRALAGGNLPGGRHRLEQCRAELETQLASDGAAPSEGSTPPSCADDAALCALATVRGCLGDCARSQGEVGVALEHYLASSQLLEAVGNPGPDAQQTLSVTLNKVAELHHMRGDLDTAMPFYRRALALREAVLARAGSPRSQPRAWAAAALPALTSLVKTGAAAGDAGEADEADALLRRAKGMFADVSAQREVLDPAQQRRLEGLQLYLEQRSAPASA